MSALTPRRYYGAMVLIFLLALVVRVLIWNDQARAGWIQAGDEDEYYRGAIHILLHGDYYDDGQWLRPPMDSIYLAGAFALFGINVPAALLYEAALSLITLALVTNLARRIFRRRAYALTAAFATALFLPWAVYASRLLSENIFTLFVALAFVFLVRATTRVAPTMNARYLLLGGIALALATLTRPLLLYALPLLLVWTWWETHKISSALRAWSILACGFVLLVAPWTFRNYVVYHQFVAVDTNGGVSFWFGTLLEPDEKNLQADWNANLPNSALRQQAALAKGFDNIRRAPLTWIARMPQKIIATYQPDTRNLANNSVLGAIIEFDSVAYALTADTEYIVLVVAALVSLAMARRAERSAILLAWPLYMTALSAVTLGNSRFRIPLMIVPLVYAAPVLAQPREAWRTLLTIARPRKIFLACALVVFFALIYSSSYLPFFESQFWLVVVRVSGGEAALARAIESAPDNVFPYIALGDYKLARGDSSGALLSFDSAAQRASFNTNAQAKCIALLRVQAREAEANAALADVAQMGWDNSQWYDWAWTRVPYFAVNRIEPSAPAVGVMRGVYAVDEANGVALRWTLQRAEFRVSLPNAQHLNLRLRADQDKNVDVYVNGEYLATLAVKSTWMDYSVALESPASAQTLVGLCAPTGVVSVDEPYARGVAVAAIELK